METTSALHATKVRNSSNTDNQQSLNLTKRAASDSGFNAKAKQGHYGGKPKMFTGL
jgi:hypothetical protein